MKKVFAILGCLFAVAVLAVPAMAQERASKVKGKGTGNIRVNDADKGVEELDLQNIEGRIYKPSVFYVLARGDVQYAGLEMRQNFVDRIVKGAMRRPF